MSEHPDLLRLRQEYDIRSRNIDKADTYSLFNLTQLYTIQQRQRVILRVLHDHGITNLSTLKIFEMGCGSGGVLSEFHWMGATLGNLIGVDLLQHRLFDAQRLLPVSHFANANGQHLPYAAHSFDIVLQFTAISSILDQNLRCAICADMLRVTRPGGLILSYDFWLNPTNPQTRGLRPVEIRALFPGYAIEFHKITLAPPIARRLVPISWGLAHFLETIKLFNTHYLAAIRVE